MFDHCIHLFARFLESFFVSVLGGKLRTAESIVEEAKGKLSELEQRIKEAIEKNAQLKSVEMMQVCRCAVRLVSCLASLDDYGPLSRCFLIYFYSWK